jgi:hypothetical protein
VSYALGKRLRGERIQRGGEFFVPETIKVGLGKEVREIVAPGGMIFLSGPESPREVEAALHRARVAGYLDKGLAQVDLPEGIVVTNE